MIQNTIERFKKNKLASYLYKMGVLNADAIYPKNYYSAMDRSSAIQDGRDLSNAVVAEYSPTSVIAFGCGTGRLLYPYFEKGIDVHGIDASSVAIEESELPRECLQQYDLTNRYWSEDTYHIALAIEILEHLPASAADTAVDSITDSAKVVLVSAATPGQGGTHHINEQPPEYWIKKFEAEDMIYKPQKTDRILAEIDLIDLNWIEDNLLVFENKNE